MTFLNDLSGFDRIVPHRLERTRAPGEAEDGAGAMADGALQREAAAVALHQRAAERQPEPGAAGGAAEFVLDLVEGLEHRLELVGRDAAAGVTHPDLDAVP